MLAGYLICATLSALALYASVSAATRIGLAPGSELALGSVVLWIALILAPIHVLGCCGWLWPWSLALASVVTSVLVVWLSAWGERLAVHLGATRDAMITTLARGWELARSVCSAGPLGVAALLALCLCLSWTSLLTYLLPSDSWDGVWYHELMVGYAIQQHGYATIHLPAGLFQQADGYPRNSEMLSLWFVIFADRKLIELPSVIAAVPLLLSTYCLCQRFASDRASSMLWAVSMVLLPGARLQMRTTYVDLFFGALLLAAYYFASDPGLNARRTLVVASALGLALGSKGQALLAVPFLFVLAAALVLSNEHKAGLRRSLAFGLAGLCAITLLGGVTYLINWFRHRNPFWPVALSVGPLEFPGTVQYAQLEVNQSFNLLDNLLDVPRPGHDFVDTKVTGYGLFGYCVFPFAALGVLVAAYSGAKAALFRRASSLESEAPRKLASLIGIVAVAGFSLWKSPAIWSARYNLAAVAALVVVVHWFSRRFRRSSALSWGAASAAFITNVALWVWSDPGWGPKGIVRGPADLVRLARAPALERATLSPLFDRELVLARERELKRGDVVVWTDGCLFPSLLWNDRFSNVLVYLPPAVPGERWLDEAERLDARWAVIGRAAAPAAKSRRDRWQRVADTNREHSPLPVFRRLR